MKNYTTYSSPVGPLYLIAEDDTLTGIYFEVPNLKNKLVDCIEKEVMILKKTRLQLADYFSGKRKSFDLKIKFVGTEFQKRAWMGLQKIPFGKTYSYGEQAQLIGKNQAIRAIGTANGQNPISIVVPCHRVIRSDGSLGGYAGGLPAKEFLLKLEGNN